MNNSLQLNRILISAAVLLGFQSLVSAGTLDEYYAKMVLQRTANRFNDLAATEEVDVGEHTVTLYLIVGDIFDFIGNTSPGSRNNVTPIDAMIVSTNIGLDFSTNNPTIQRKLREDLPKNVKDRIQSAFRRKGPLKTEKEYVEAVIVDAGIKFSPKSFCFIATDRPEGGTLRDEKWLTYELSKDRIGARVYNCLANSHESKPETIAIPLIGSSKVDLNSGFIAEKSKRIEMRNRMSDSIAGILQGVKAFLVSKPGKDTHVKEFAIIVWDEDIKRMIPEKRLTDGTFRDAGLAGGYVELRDRLKQTFEAGSNDIQAALSAQARNSN